MTKKKFARVISNIFVPPSGTLLLSLFLASQFAVDSIQWHLIFWIGALFGFILPIVVFAILHKLGKVADVDATVKEERLLPYLAGIVLAGIASYLSSTFNLPMIVTAMWLSYALSTTFLVIINKFWKISAHAIGNFSPAAILFYVYPLSLVLLMPLLIIILWSRLELKKHTPAQLLAGSVYGFGFTILVIHLYLH
ncbi:MAG: hypothetical protein SCALA702_35340 [Melioribacteraceae bacterium]|nr:MAG: hypothetical protein SCALA702_35340 [Melioribacteraceae bacterium]